MDRVDLEPEIIRRVAFAVAQLPPDCPKYWDILREFVFANKESPGDSSHQNLKVIVENLQVLHEKLFATDKALAMELQTLNYDQFKPLGVVLISTNQFCIECGGKLLIRGDRSSTISIYTESQGTLLGSHLVKYCRNSRRGCKFSQHYGYHTLGGSSSSVYDENWSELPYILSTNQTAFEIKLLERFDVELLIGELSYKQKSEIYNCVNGYDDVQKKCASMGYFREQPDVMFTRLKLDRRRLEAGHMRYALLRVRQRHTNVFTSNLAISHDVSSTIENITPRYFIEFTKKFAEHSCRFPGCQEVMVLDGNMKNRRHVCNAKYAGFIEYPGLPGRVKTGCMRTPGFKSRYCGEHQLHSCTTDRYEEIADIESYKKCDDTPPTLHKSTSNGEAIVEILLQKKELRNKTYYEVLWLGQTESKSTWVPADALPQKAIEDFNNGSCKSVNVLQQCEEAYGEQRHTLISAGSNSVVQNFLKRPRISRPVIEGASGVFRCDKQDIKSLTCNTEKDKDRPRTHRTAGILAGVRPCGIIVLLSELFISESKTQVYGALHSFYKLLPNVASKIEYLCYDDGCHLRKFARNTIRANVTRESEILAKQHIVVDKMHMRGHIDDWCKHNCDPAKYPFLNDVNTEVCEQTFSWLSKYSRITQSMSQHTFMFFLLYLCELHNIREEEKLGRAKLL